MLLWGLLDLGAWSLISVNAAVQTVVLDLPKRPSIAPGT